MLKLIFIRFLVGGFLVSGFSILGTIFKPKSFAALFGAVLGGKIKARNVMRAGKKCTFP